MVVKEEMESFKTVLENGTVEYVDCNGKYHREDGPAVESVNGNQYWFINGVVHREDGPAVEYMNGPKHWYIDGCRHREDGPAIELANGEKQWYINGENLTEDEFLNWQLKNSKTIKLNFQ